MMKWGSVSTGNTIWSLFHWGLVRWSRLGESFRPSQDLPPVTRDGNFESMGWAVGEGCVADSTNAVGENKW